MLFCNNSDLDGNLLLLLGRQQGFQVWHIKSDDEVVELISYSNGIGKCTLIQLCPTPGDLSRFDVFKSKRPLIMLVDCGISLTWDVKFYSLSNSEFVSTISFTEEIHQIKASANFFAVVVIADNLARGQKDKSLQ